MANKKPSSEYGGLYNRFLRYVGEDNKIHDAEFAADVKTLRKSTDDIRQPIYENVEIVDGDINADEMPSPLSKFMSKYGFPRSMDEFLYHYIIHRKVDVDKLQSGVYLVDDEAMHASGRYEPEQNYKNYIDDSQHAKYINLTLAIPLDATNVQITKALTEAKDFIANKQARVRGAGKTRDRYSLMTKRDNLIMKLHKQGKKPKEILFLLPEKWQNTDPTNISKIIYRMKNSRKHP
ncbi:hypothetical protein EOM57_01695 [Candidatus Saccharibacteria bacterium]|nr:hypothetical protein [Candidatus Saccharibacteria bacterium]NCU38724.1 hypothetical protein [Candidatus Saccharibacteria bacterium]